MVDFQSKRRYGWEDFLEIMRLLERINALGTTVLVVTHEKDLVNRFDKRVVMLERGRVVSDGHGYYGRKTL